MAFRKLKNRNDLMKEYRKEQAKRLAKCDPRSAELVKPKKAAPKKQAAKPKADASKAK